MEAQGHLEARIATVATLHEASASTVVEFTSTSDKTVPSLVQRMVPVDFDFFAAKTRRVHEGVIGPRNQILPGSAYVVWLLVSGTGGPSAALQ